MSEIIPIKSQKTRSRKVYRSYAELPLTLTVHDVADVLSISYTKAYQVISAKDFPLIKHDGRYLIPKTQFLDWLSHQSTYDNHDCATNNQERIQIEKTKQELIQHVLSQQELMQRLVLQQNEVIKQIINL
jgi:excisionase family DNA binding protein